MQSFIIILFHFLFLYQNSFAGNVRPTYGGAYHGEESTTSQQLSYVLMKLPLLLEGWNLKLIPESVVIDSENDHDQKPLARYEYQSSNVVFFPYITRTVHFTVVDLENTKKMGHLYLVETKNIPHIFQGLAANSTAQMIMGLRKKYEIRMSLSESIEVADFQNELRMTSFHFREFRREELPFGSTYKKVRYIEESLQQLLNPYGYQVLLPSINVDYFTDYGFIYNFPERYGQMVSFIVENSNREKFNGQLTLWENHGQHKVSLNDEDCNSTLLHTHSAFNRNQIVKLTLSQGYQKRDIKNEIDLSVIKGRVIDY